MDIINIISISDNIVAGIKSFIIYDDEFSDKIIAKAEGYFLKECEKIGLTTNEINPSLNDGFYLNSNQEKSVCISWSEV